MMEAGQLLFKSGHLSELSKVLSERFSSLTTWLCQLKSNPNSDFLHVTQKSLDESELEYLPTFHIIIVKLENHASIVEKFQLSLLSYNGKLLAKEEVPTDYIVSSEYLNHLNKGSIRLCRGTSDMNGSSNLVREYLGNTIVLRSEECPYAIMEIEPQSNLKTQCKFCAIAQLKSFGGISPSAHFDLPKSEGKVFESDRTVKNESQLDFLAISEEDGFVNSNGRRRKSKRSNAKSLSARKKPSHQKGKEIKQEEEISYLVSDNFQVDFSDGDQIEPNGSWVEEDNRDELCLDDKRSMTCKKCGREYKSKHPYLKHTRKCLQGEEVPKFSENCKICLKHFYQEKQLERHLEHHRSKHNLEDTIICPECNETLETKLDLNPHFQSVHSRDKGCCIECLEVLESSQLQRHLYSRHFYSVKDRLCTSCGETFASPLKLRVHISSVHDDTGNSYLYQPL